MTARLSIVLAMTAMLVVACGDSDSPTGPTALPVNGAATDALFAPVMPVADVPSMPVDAMTGGTVIVLDDLGDNKQYGLGINLSVGERRQLRTQHGGVDRTEQTTWTSNNTNIADFPDVKGRIRGRKVGTAWMRAQWGRHFRTMRVEVVPGNGEIPDFTGQYLDQRSVLVHNRAERGSINLLIRVPWSGMTAPVQQIDVSLYAYQRHGWGGQRDRYNLTMPGTMTCGSQSCTYAYVVQTRDENSGSVECRVDLAFRAMFSRAETATVSYTLEANRHGHDDRCKDDRTYTGTANIRE